MGFRRMRFYENYRLCTSDQSVVQIAIVLGGNFKILFFLNSHGNTAADAVDRAGQPGSGHRTTGFYQRHLCVKLCLTDHKICNRVFTYWTGRNWRDEFLVPGFKLVNFNDWFLDFNWFLFYRNGDFFLCKSNETDSIKNEKGNGKFFHYSCAT